MRNNLAELTGAAIYRFHRRWRPIWKKHASGWREGRFTDAGYRGIHWHVDPEDRQATYCGQWRRDNKAIAWQTRFNGDHHCDGRAPTSRHKWMGDRATTVLWLHPRRDLFTRGLLSVLYWARIKAPIRIRGQGHRRRGSTHLRYFRLLYYGHLLQSFWLRDLRSLVLHFPCDNLLIGL
jgi:hypothetical protein